MSSPNPLSRDQKLLAEVTIQLGNIAEAIRLASGVDHQVDYKSKVEELETELATLNQERTTIMNALEAATLKVSQLQAVINADRPGDLTPDTLAEVLQSLNIEVPE